MTFYYFMWHLAQLTSRTLEVCLQAICYIVFILMNNNNQITECFVSLPIVIIGK